MAKNEKVESMSFTFLLLNILVIVCALFSMVLSAIGAYWEATIAILYESGGLVLYILVELAGLVVLIISGIAACMYWCGVGERQMLMNQQQQHLKAKMSGFSRVVPPRAQPAAFYVQGQVQVTVPPGTKLTGQDNGSSDIPVGGNQVPPEYISLQNPPEYKKAPQAEEGV
uniref:Uncharacterized protein LOC102807438 n=1 Tax=Saccoglossus kowalevskii TaxID=10224 RepID=A0ABM0M5V9_SACKO|nr:PREDICTED: uncharacterized protein LOC102807438 [Saccoglossus kowalevskii]